MSVSAAHLGGGEQQQAAAVEPPQKRGVTGYLLLLPGALWLTLFFLVPTITLVSTSLYDPAGSVDDRLLDDLALAELRRRHP